MSKKMEFGKVQTKIMQVLWDKNRATAREITEALNKEGPIAHSTVYTLLLGLEKKGAIAHDVDNRTYIFYPLVPNEKFVNHTVRDLIDRIFAGSAGGVVSYLLKNQFITHDEVKKISEMIKKEKQ